MEEQYYIVFSDKEKPNGLNLMKTDKIIFRKLSYNNIHKNLKYEIEKNKLEKEFQTTINSDNNMINIIFISELNQRQLETYLKTYNNEPDNLREYAEYLSIIKYNQVSINKLKVVNKFDSILDELSSFWEDSKNCEYSLNEKYMKRNFNTNFIEKNKIFDNHLKKITSNKEENYMEDIEKEIKSQSLILADKEYFLGNISDMSISELNELYQEIPCESEKTDYLRYSFIANLLCSRTHCHLILNNKELLISAKPIFDKYKLVFKYLIGYSWITLIMEETNKYTRIKDDDRIVFDIDTVNNLPIFPFTYEDINQNPYACVLMDNKSIDLKNNCISLNMLRDYEKYYGVCTSEEFSRRLNIFVNGKNEKGILEKIDWNTCAITGSAMTACGMKYNPLIDICKSQDNPNVLSDEDLNTYYFHYYNNSDIDLICKHSKLFDFLDTVNKLKIDLEDIHGQVNMSSVHTATVVISDEFIIYLLEDIQKYLNDKTISLEYIKKNYSKQEIKNYFYDNYYIPWKQEQVEMISITNTSHNKLENCVYLEHLTHVPREEFRIYFQDYESDAETHKKNDSEKYFYMSNLYDKIGYEESKSKESDNCEKDKLVAKLSESLRFKLSTKEAGVKTFEIFRTMNQDFIGVVAKFHMGFVRAIWNGTTVKCLPSYITSMMLQISTDYKYFSSIRDPVEIINKYRSRGFGIILNDNEKRYMIYFNTVKIDINHPNTKWIEMYNVDNKVKASVNSIFGPRNINDNIFKPSKYFMGLENDCYQVVNSDILITFDGCFSSIINQNIADIKKMKAISDSGFINPLDKDIIKYGWIKVNNINSNRRFMN